LNAKLRERLAFALLALVTVLVIVPVVFVLLILLIRGLPAISWQFLTQEPRSGMTEGGIFPAIVGTFYLVVGTVIVALPLGIGGAVYMTEYARPGKALRLIRLAIVNLAGVPSVVYGLFGLGLFVIFLKLGTSLISGCLTLGVLVLPIVITATEEALRAVPQSFREASASLGASKWQTVSRVVLPTALPGILTGTILAISRAAGETAPILFTCAAFYLSQLPRSIFDPILALPYHLYGLATQATNAPDVIKYGTALVLIALVFGTNITAIVLRLKARRTKRW
jgi:phosphate transport system permease protein